MGKLYKIRHKPTGLFLKPSAGDGNLSKKGKIYETESPWTAVCNGHMYQDIIAFSHTPKIFNMLLEKYPDSLICSYKLMVKTQPSDFERVDLN